MTYVPGIGQQLGALCTPWAVPDDVCVEGEAPSDVLLSRWLAVAGSNLFNLTGRQWPGECTTTWYPAADGCAPRPQLGLPGQRIEGDRLRLPGYPVRSIEEVVIEGVMVAPERYRVEDYRTLVLLPGDAVGPDRAWPRGGDWSVTYVYGASPPPGGREAAAALGYQLALSCSPDTSGCRLPQRVQSITRQGVSMAILDPLTLFPDGMTGLPEVDSWVAAQRLGAARRPGMVYLPGRRPMGHRRTYVPTGPVVPPPDPSELILYGGDSEG